MLELMVGAAVALIGVILGVLITIISQLSLKDRDDL